MVVCLEVQQRYLFVKMKDKLLEWRAQYTDANKKAIKDSNNKKL